MDKASGWSDWLDVRAGPPPRWPTWQIGTNEKLSPIRFAWPWDFGGATGRYSVLVRTPALWARWPTTWRQQTKPSRLQLVCAAPGTWTDAEASFAPLIGQPLTREQFCAHGGAAYPFILNRPRWGVSLPDHKHAASDVKRAALGMAFAEVLNDYITVETLMEWKKYSREDALEDYPRARHIFEGRDDFNHLTNWIHRIARNHVRAVMHGVEAPLPVESMGGRKSRKRLRADGECPECWNAVPLRGSRGCAHCGLTLPRGVWISLTESACRKRAADPWAPARVQLDDRLQWPRFTGARTALPPLSSANDVLERIAKRDAEEYAERALVGTDGVVVPLRATVRQLWDVEDGLTARSSQSDARREGIPAHLRDDGEPRRVTSRPHGAGVGHGSNARGKMSGGPDDNGPHRDGETEPASRVHYAKDGERRRAAEELRISLKLEVNDGAARELKYVRRMIRKMVEARRYILAKMPPEAGAFALQVTQKGTDAHRAWLREQREAKKRGWRVSPRRLPATEAGWLYIGLESQWEDVTVTLDELVTRRSRLLAESDDPQWAAFKTRKNEPIYIDNQPLIHGGQNADNLG